MQFEEIHNHSHTACSRERIVGVLKWNSIEDQLNALYCVSWMLSDHVDVYNMLNDEHHECSSMRYRKHTYKGKV